MPKKEALKALNLEFDHFDRETNTQVFIDKTAAAETHELDDIGGTATD